MDVSASGCRPLMTIAQLTFAQHPRYAVADHSVVKSLEGSWVRTQESMEQCKQ